MDVSPAGYVTPGVVPVGAGPEQLQRGALRRYGAPWAPLQDAVGDRFNDPVAVGYNPATQTWAGPQDALVNFPAQSAANYLALQYAAPGSADVAGLPGKPRPYMPPVGAVDGSAPAMGR